MAVPARRSRPTTDLHEPRERRKRESFTPLALLRPDASVAGGPVADGPVHVANAHVADVPVADAPSHSVAPDPAAEPAFHAIEEEFFRAGAEDTLPRNPGDEYEETPGLLQRVFRR